MIHRGPSKAGEVGILAAKGCECNAQRQNLIPWAAEGHQKDLRRESNGKTDASKGQMWLQPGWRGVGREAAHGGCQHSETERNPKAWARQGAQALSAGAAAGASAPRPPELDSSGAAPGRAVAAAAWAAADRGRASARSPSAAPAGPPPPPESEQQLLGWKSHCPHAPAARARR